MLGCLEFGYSIYDKLGLEIKVELSTRPDNKIGTDEEWDAAEDALADALNRLGLAYSINAGDGAFYGPKIDLHMLDSLGRAWQIGTVQLDFQMPQRFGLTYQGADNAEHTPVMIHRALIGSFERFIGILIEHFAGAFPFWLAPVQVRIIPVGLDHHGAAEDLADRLVGLPRRGRRLGRDRRQADPERRGRQDPASRSSTATRSPTSRSPCGSTAETSPRSPLRSYWSCLLLFLPDKQGRNCLSPPGRAVRRGLGGSTEVVEHGASRCFVASL